MNSDKNKEAELLWQQVSQETENAGEDFFTGSGSSSISKNHQDPESYSDQLMVQDEVEIPFVNDLHTFEVEETKITNDEMYSIVFTSGKKKAYSIFDYLKIKSTTLGGAPRKEEDLILSEEDYQIINELKSLTQDYHAVYNLAVMYAYLDMGITEVQFKQNDGCPLCKALNGSIFDLYNTINLVCSSHGVSHRYCDCEFLPIIHREHSYGVLDENLNVPEFGLSVDLGDTQTVLNMPREMSVDLSKLIPKLSNHIIEFLDIGEYLNNNNDVSDYSSGTVVVEDEERLLFVHNSYVGNLGPVDFVKAFLLEESSKKLSAKELKGLEPLYYKGKKVVEFQGKYWDFETGDQI